MVRATFGGFTTALSALQASQKRLDITGQNLANMNTPGYTRQQLQVSSMNYSGPVSHYMNGSEIVVGFGTHMDSVTQLRDPFLDSQYRVQMAKAGYTDSFQIALDSLATVLDETSISGIRQSLDDIQSTLENLTDASKVNDPIYESELRSRMESFTNLLNDAARQILEAEKEEYIRLDGDGSSENGAVQQVNDMLRQIGNLNRQIKKNQIMGQSSLELMDERNLLLDELASYIPIEITYYKDENHDGLDANGNPAPGEIYEYDSNNQIIGKKEWPDDLKVELVYTDENGDTQRLTLVDGTKGTGDQNYGKLEMDPAAGTKDNPLDAAVIFTEAAASAAAGAPAASVTISGDPDENHMSEGSIQASLDVLASDGVNDSVRGYDFYMKKLDTLAQTFAATMNQINQNGQSPASGSDGIILVDRTDQSTNDITAANIGISQNWISGAVHLGTAGESANDTALAMLKAMSDTYGGDMGNTTFADFMNNTSTLLANDSYSNQTVLANNVTVLNGIQNSRDSISGVSLDEEAANMMTYLSAYNAASRLMTALDEALNTLINNTGTVGR